jgi:Pyruvate/2-oxoacid:ferredoxin oxidoreductase delta subunit/GNAT superfamily N-acetyltransferase
MEVTEVTENLKMEFREMNPGQEKEVSDLVREVARIDDGEMEPAARTALERYIAPSALAGRAKMGYTHELAYVSDVLAGVIEVKGLDHIAMLYIRPAFANRGIGSRLIARAASRCVAAAPKVKYMTVEAAAGSLDFYERTGFTRSGPARMVGGVLSTPCRLALGGQRSDPPMKLHSSSIDLFVFSGTGNTLLLSQAVAEVLRQEGASVRLRDMESPPPANFPEDVAIGLAFPVACFSTYPVVWRFIHALPAGEGREIFMLGTCGGASGGMQGPLRDVLKKKGYKTVAAEFFVMPGTYNNKTLPLERNAARIEKALLGARFFAYDLLQGRTRWGGGIPLLSALLYRWGQTRKPWNFFFRLFPLAVDEKKCTRCGRCAEICPEKAITMNGPSGLPALDASLCQSCQRCVGFCPAAALGVPGKPAVPWKAMSWEEFRSAFR